MKNKIKTFAQIILAATFIFTACKKKDDTNETTNTTTTTTGSPVAVTKTMTASVSNANWQANSSYGFLINYTNLKYNFSGQTSTSPDPYTLISFALPNPISTGTYSLSSSGAAQAFYKDSSGVFYTSNNGSINITTIDTTNQAGGIITKFKATFNFTTAAVSSKSYTVNNGVVDYTK